MKKNKKRNFAVLILFICACIFNCAHVMPVFAEESKEPDVCAQGAILMDFETGRVLWEKNAHEPMAMASTTKIMTAILAIELGNLKDEVVVSRRAEIAPRVKMYLRKGEIIALGDLLHALMLQSSNDAAVAIAEHIGGDVENFCIMMTAKAKEIGAENTVFETPNGLDGENHHSTAYDMALIARYALQNPKFNELINTPQTEVKSSRATYNIINKNRLLREFDGANGVKTGYTGKAGHCFVGSALRDEMQLISVAFACGWGQRGKEQKWIDTKKILIYGFDNYAFENIISAGEIAGELNIERSKTPTIALRYSESLDLPLNQTEREEIRIKTEFPDLVRAPVEADTVIGTAKVYINGEFSHEIDLFTTASASRHDLKTSLEKVLQSFLKAGTIGDIEIILPEF